MESMTQSQSAVSLLEGAEDDEGGKFGDIFEYAGWWLQGYYDKLKKAERERLGFRQPKPKTPPKKALPPPPKAPSPPKPEPPKKRVKPPKPEPATSKLGLPPAQPYARKVSKFAEKV